MGSGQGHHPQCKAYCRKRECRSKPVKGAPGPYKLEAMPVHIQQNRCSVGPTTGATHLSAQLERFYNWRPVPRVEAVDAFLQDWAAVRGYANSPWCLIMRCLKKVANERVTLMMIMPLWPTQPWFSVLMSMCADPPRSLPQRVDILLPTANAGVPMPLNAPKLVAWHISEEPL